MTRHIHTPGLAAALSLLLGSLAAAAPGRHAELDGGWLDPPSDAATEVSPIGSPVTEADIAALANLDDDPSVTTEKEREMMVVLRQVLGVSPLGD